MDQKAIEGAGYDKGVKVGIERGIEKVAKNMIKNKIDINIIIETTGLTKEEIENLKK